MNKKRTLFKLPSWAWRIQVGFDWAWQLLFPRDLTHLRTRQTESISYAHYKSGDIIMRQGEMPEAFYLIESGQVEVVAIHNRARPEVVNTLGPRSLIGDKALLKGEPARFAVRAQTAVKVLVMGRTIFAEVSKALRDAIAQTINSPQLARPHRRNTEALFSTASLSR